MGDLLLQYENQLQVLTSHKVVLDFARQRGHDSLAEFYEREIARAEANLKALKEQMEGRKP